MPTIVQRVECDAPDCSGGAVTSLSISASNSVFVRSATDVEQQQQTGGAAAFVVGNGDAEDFVAVAKVEVDATTGLQTLHVGSFDGDSGLEVVLMTPGSVQLVTTVGSGKVVLEDHVLATSGAISLATSGSGSLFATSSDVMDLSLLEMKNEGSGGHHITFSNVHATIVEATTTGSGDITVFADSLIVSSSAVLTSSGSGNVCLASVDSLEIEKLQVSLINSGGIFVTSSAGAGASCDSLNIEAVGSGNVDTGGVQCKTGSVTVFGSSDVTVQVSDSLTGKAFGHSDSIRYAGSAPQSIGNSYYGGSIASPVKSSYKPAVCKQRAFPVFRHDSSVLVNPTNPPPVDSAPPLPPSDVAPDAIPAPPSGPTGTPPGTGSPEPDSSPFVVDKHHLDALLPLGAAALIAALALWRFNSSRAKRRQESEWYGPQEYNQDGNKGEQQPLVGGHQPVYI